MKTLSSLMTTQSQGGYLRARAAHEDFRVLEEAMSKAGILTVHLKSTILFGRGFIPNEMEMVCDETKDLTIVTSIRVPLIEIDESGMPQIDRNEVVLWDAIAIVANQIAETAVPGWWSSTDSLAISITTRKGVDDANAKEESLGNPYFGLPAMDEKNIRADLKVTPSDPNAKVETAEFYVGDPILVFADQEIVSSSEGKHWLRIDTKEKAKAATQMIQNWTEVYYDLKSAGNDIQWFILFEETASGDLRAAVTLGAGDKDSLIRIRCHVSGERSSNVYEAYRTEIDDLARDMNLKVEPNHLGIPLPW
jgi:hypothetical protein